jgi:hypothetical protein
VRRGRRRTSRGGCCTGCRTWGSGATRRAWSASAGGSRRTRPGAYIAAIVAGEALPAGDAYALPASERMAKSVLAMLNFGVIDRRSFINQFGCAVDDAFAAAIAIRGGGGVAGGSRGAARGGGGRFDAMPRIRALFYSAAAIAWVRGAGRLPLFGYHGRS